MERVRTLLLGEVIRAGLGGERTEEGWMVFCPVHKDERPALDVRIRAGGLLTVKCRAGCSGDRVIEELERLGLARGTPPETEDSPWSDRDVYSAARIMNAELEPTS